MTEIEDRDELLEREQVEATAVPPMAIGGALAAGLVGAAVWAGIAIATDYEIGWIAWGIGAAVGAAFFKLGGRGGVGPVLCAVIALASIAGGKYAAFRIGVNNEVELFIESPLTRIQFESAREFGGRYAAAKTDAEREELAREWTVAEDEDPASVTDSRLDQFRQNELPEIQAIHEGRRTYEQFTAEFRELLLADVSFADALSGFDLLWIFLGVGTAFRLAAGGVD